MKRLFLFGAMVAGLVGLPATAIADWHEDFDSYVAGSQIVGQGGWEEWSAGAGALVSSAQARSINNSVDINGPTDLVHQYYGYTSGRWTYTAWQYVPSGLTGVNPTYFIMLNTYNYPSGPYDWSVQVGMDPNDGLVHADCGSSNQVTMPYVADQWIEIKVIIDLDEDWTQIYYDGTLLDDPALPDHPTLGGGYSWTGGTFGGGSGALDIAAVDLFAYGATSAYYDDMSLRPATTWCDDIDSYLAGSQIVGQGGWEEWSAGAGAFVSNAQSRSTYNSIDINGPTDLVHQYSGYTSGQWSYTAWQYVPSGLTGVNPTYFIMLNTYTSPSGPYDWSVQVGFDPNDGLLKGDCGSSNQVTMPYLADQWVEIRVDIDLDEDWTQIYYDGTLLDDPALPDHPTLGGGYSWTGGTFGGGSGALDIAALDLFAYGATSAYYDDLSLEAFVPLKASTDWISTHGDSVALLLNAGAANSDRDYIILGSLSGTSPGTVLPGNLVTLPLNWDSFTDFALQMLNSAIFTDFYGTLDGSGRAMAQINAPSIHGCAGITMNYAYTMANPFDFASNPITIVTKE